MNYSDEVTFEAWQERSSHILDELKHVDAFQVLDAAEPWSPPSLNAIEQHMLETWSTFDDVPTGVREQYESFLGEGLIRRFGGVWVRLHPELLGKSPEHYPSALGIKYPESEAIDVVSSLLPFAYRTGTGTWWSSNFHMTHKLARAR